MRKIPNEIRMQNAQPVMQVPAGQNPSAVSDSESGNVQMTAGQAPDEEPTVNQELLDFFDAMDEKNYDRMLECLTKLSHATRRNS